MSNYRITDDHAVALLDGHVPEGREDLQPLAAVVGALRLASFESPPQPSAALAGRLDLDRLAWVSATRRAGVPACDAERTTVLTRRPAKGKVKPALGWFTGLGVAAQLALGAGAVSASAAGIGLAGALPPVAQEVFDTVVATVAHADELLTGESTAEDVADGNDVDGPPAAGDAAEENSTAPDESDAMPADDPSDDAADPDEAGKPQKPEKPTNSRDSKPSKETGAAAGSDDAAHGSAGNGHALGKKPDTGDAAGKKGGVGVQDADIARRTADELRAFDKSGNEAGETNRRP